MQRPASLSPGASATSCLSDTPTQSTSPTCVWQKKLPVEGVAQTTPDTTDTTSSTFVPRPTRTSPITTTRATPITAANAAPTQQSTSAASSSSSSTLETRFYTLHYDFVLASLEAKAKTLDRCTYFFFYAIFVVGFCFYFMYDYDVLGRYQLHSSLLDTLSKAEMPRLKSQFRFSEVSTAVQYAQYIVHGVAPLLADVRCPTGSSIPLGSLRVRTQRSVLAGCGDPSVRSPASFYATMMCPDSTVSAAEDTGRSRRTRFDLETLWKYRSCKQLGGSAWAKIHGDLGSYHCGGFIYDSPLWVLRATFLSTTFTLATDVPPPLTSPPSGDLDDVNKTVSADGPPAEGDTSSNDDGGGVSVNTSPALGTAEQAFPFTSRALLRERISQEALQSRHLRHLFWKASVPFLDNYATRVAVTEVLFYNPSLQLFATVKLVGEVTLGGTWKTSALVRTARAWTRDDVGKSVYDAVVMVLALVWLVQLVTHAVLSVRHRVAERMASESSIHRNSSSSRAPHRSPVTSIPSSHHYADTDTNCSSLDVKKHRGPTAANGSSSPWLTGGVVGRDTTGVAPSPPLMVRLTAIAEHFNTVENLSAIVILALFIATAGFRVASVVHSGRSVPTLDQLIFAGEYPMQVECLFYLDRVQLYLNATLVILLFFRLLCYVTVDANAARAVQLLARTQSTLCGYLCLSVLCITTYAITLKVLYGHSIWTLRSVDSCFNFLVRLMVRQHDTHDIASVTDGALHTAFLLLSFYLIGVLATISLGVAVLVHVFGAIRRAEPSPTLDAYQIRWLLTRMRRCVLAPRRWWTFLWRWCRGYGDAALLRHACCCLRSFRHIQFPAPDHVEGEVRQLLSRDEFVEAMLYACGGDGMPFTASSPSSLWPSSQKEEDASASRSGVWMTWVTRSSSETPTAATERSGAAGSLESDRGLGEGGGGGGGGDGGRWDDGSGDASRRRHTTSPPTQLNPPHGGSRGEQQPSVREEDENSAASRFSTSDREVLRRRWRQRWGTYRPEELWADVYHDWIASTTSEASLHFREEIVWLRNGVQAAVGNNLTHVKQFPHRLAELERKLKMLESFFSENELTASDKVEREERADGGT